MSFLNPFFLFGSLALAIPVLVHLVRREKSEIVPFSSLMFLLKVPKRSIRQQKIKNLLLMALRLLILAFLVGAFARPYITAPNTPGAATGQDRGVVLLLDDSYSMRYGTNFERMKAEATKRIDAMTARDKMVIVTFSDKATLLTQPTSDKAKLKAAVSVLEPSFEGTRFFEAFSVADRAFTEMATPQKQLIVISDFQRVGWNRSSRESVLANDVKTETVDLSVPNPANVGIDSVIVDATSFMRTYGGHVVARVHNYHKDQPVSVPVSVQLNGHEAARKNVTISANETALAEFTGFDLPLGFTKGTVKIETADMLPVDNEFSFTINRREKLNVLIVDAGKSRQSLYLRQAYTSSAELPFAVRVVTAQSVTADDISKSEVLIVNDVPSLSDAVQKRMDEMRRAGQGQLVILGSNSDLGWWNKFQNFPVKAGQRVRIPTDRGLPSYSVTSYDRNHTIFSLFEKSTKLALNAVQFWAYVQTDPTPGSLVLAKFEDGAPALVESAPSNRGLMVFTSTVDSFWNDLPLKPSFLPLFHEIVRYLSRYSDTRGWYPLGEGVPLVGGLDTTTAAVINADNERVPLGSLAPGEQHFYTPEKPGFYELRVGPDSRLIAVNPSSVESNLDPMPAEDLLASVQRTQGEAQQAGFFGQDEKDDYARRQTGWWYLLLFALLAGIAEIYIANRAYNRAQ